MSLDVDAIAERVRVEVARRLLAAATALQAAHQADVSGPSPAGRGNFPGLRTGAGRAGVVVTPAGLSEVMRGESVAVGYREGGVHLWFLGGRGWKGLVDTYARELPKLRAILQG